MFFFHDDPMQSTLIERALTHTHLVEYAFVSNEATLLTKKPLNGEQPVV